MLNGNDRASGPYYDERASVGEPSRGMFLGNNSESSAEPARDGLSICVTGGALSTEVGPIRCLWVNHPRKAPMTTIPTATTAAISNRAPLAVGRGFLTLVLNEVSLICRLWAEPSTSTRPALPTLGFPVLARRKTRT
jgi:hypothetical protein